MSDSSPSEHAENELLLLLCGTKERRAAQNPRIRELARRIEAERFLTVVATQRVAELAGSRLLEHAPDETPRRVLDAAVRARRANRIQALALEAATEHVLTRLDADRVRALALKGVRLARLLYDDPGLRAAGDIDVLIAPEDLETAVASARSVGYAGPRDPVDRSGLPALHFELFHSSLPPLELHWRTHWLESGFSAGVLARAQPGSDGRLRAHQVDEIALLLAFFARDGFAGLRLAADIASWWDRFGAGLPAGALAPLLARYPALAEAWVAAARAAESVVGLPANRLLPQVSPRRASRFARQLVNWSLRGDPDQVRANVVLVDGLLRPRAGRRDFLLGVVFPSHTTLRHGYGIPPAAGPVRIRVARVSHGVRHLLRFGLALWALRGGRFYAPLPPSARVS